MSELRGEVAHTYSDWYDRIMSYERSFKLWEGRVDKILKRYKDDSRNKTNPNDQANFGPVTFQPHDEQIANNKLPEKDSLHSSFDIKSNSLFH